MNDYLKLVDGTRVDIEEGASLDHIVHIADDETAAVAVCRKLTNENVRHVEFWQDLPDIETPYGAYDNMVLIGPPTMQVTEDEKIEVTIGLREMTEMEIEIASLKDANSALAEEVTSTEMALTELYEMLVGE